LPRESEPINEMSGSRLRLDGTIQSDKRDQLSIVPDMAQEVHSDEQSLEENIEALLDGL